MTPGLTDSRIHVYKCSHRVKGSSWGHEPRAMSTAWDRGPWHCRQNALISETFAAAWTLPGGLFFIRYKTWRKHGRAFFDGSFSFCRPGRGLHVAGPARPQQGQARFRPRCRPVDRCVGGPGPGLCRLYRLERRRRQGAAVHSRLPAGRIAFRGQPFRDDGHFFILRRQRPVPAPRPVLRDPGRRGHAPALRRGRQFHHRAVRALRPCGIRHIRPVDGMEDVPFPGEDAGRGHRLRKALGSALDAEIRAGPCADARA